MVLLQGSNLTQADQAHMKRRSTSTALCPIAGGDTYEKLKHHVDKLRQYAALDPGQVVLPRRDAPLTPEEQESESTYACH